MPIGLLRGLAELANEKARDIQNKNRFPHAIIDNGSTLTPDTKIGKSSHILRGATINHCQIGSYTYINVNALIQNTRIGNYCSIAQNVAIGLGAHPLNLFSSSPIFYKVKNALKISLVEKDYNFNESLPIIIGNDVWIGSRVIIMDNVHIGHGAVIAAGAVVTKDVPPYAIVAGIPAKVIKYRFPIGVQKKLIESKWWELDAAEVYAMKEELEDTCRFTQV